MPTYEIEELKDHFVEQLLPEQIYLFGSYANNTFTDESNLDFLHHSFGWCIRYCSGDDEGL